MLASSISLAITCLLLQAPANFLAIDRDVRLWEFLFYTTHQELTEEKRTSVCIGESYSTNCVSGPCTTTGGRRNVHPKLTAKSVTAVISMSAETGNTFQAHPA